VNFIPFLKAKTRFLELFLESTKKNELIQPIGANMKQSKNTPQK